MAFPVTVIQTTVESGDVEGNRHTILHLIAAAVARGARLIALPEACISDLYREAAQFAEPIPGPTTELVGSAAGDATVALPLLEKGADGRVYSSCAFVTKAGVKGVARKTHLYRDAHGLDAFRDAEVLTAGDTLSVVELDDVRVGVLLGYDAEFPEAFRTLALRGADLIVVALNQIGVDQHYLSAMALRNRVPLLVANRIGFRKVYPGVPEFSALALSLVQDKDGSFLARCRGGSVILDANGQALAEPSQSVQRDLESIAGAPPAAIIPLAHFQHDDLLNASFRIDEIRVQRLTSPYLAERREELYAGNSNPAAAPASASAPSPISVPAQSPEATKAPRAKPKTPRKRKTKNVE